MVEGANNSEIAAELGVNRNTVAVWRKMPEVAERVDRESLAIIEAAGMRMRDMASAALDTLTSVMAGGEGVSASAQVAAAESILKRTGIDALIAQKMDAMKTKDAPTPEEQSAFIQLVDERARSLLAEMPTDALAAELAKRGAQ